MSKCRCSICIMVGQFRYFRSRLPESEQAKFDRWFDRIFGDLEAMDTELGMQKFRQGNSL